MLTLQCIIYFIKNLIRSGLKEIHEDHLIYRLTTSSFLIII